MMLVLKRAEPHASVTEASAADALCALTQSFSTTRRYSARDATVVRWFDLSVELEGTRLHRRARR